MTEKQFYKKAADYWASVPPTIDGILGGFGHISDVDLDGSRAFLQRVFCLDRPPSRKLVLDCGAGIGRVTKGILIHNFQKVDMVEQDERFINTARKSIGEDNAKLGSIYKIGLQNFKPQKKYDVIWCQWVLGHLNDYDLLAFLERCNEALTETGLIIIKENMTTTDELEYDEDDSSVTRPMKLMQAIFDEAQLRIIIHEIQTGFPDDIYPVHMYALVPVERTARVVIV